MKIAITGIIGSGKSEVSNIVREKGARVLSADAINKELLLNTEYLKKLKNLFPSAFCGDIFVKSKLTQIVFENEEELAKLNALAHPEIMGEMMKRANGEDFVFCEVPLLDSNMAKGFDRVWLVKSQDEKRIERICKRDGRTKEEAMKMLCSQDKYKNINYDNCDIINNDGNKKDLRAVVEKLYCKLTVKNA